jgi:hypothetical protein
MDRDKEEDDVTETLEGPADRDQMPVRFPDFLGRRNRHCKPMRSSLHFGTVGFQSKQSPDQNVTSLDRTQQQAVTCRL